MTTKTSGGDSERSASESDLTTTPGGSPVPPSREGKRGIVIRVDATYHRKLRILAAERDTTLQALGEEAFRLLLERDEARRAAGQP